MAEQLYLNKRLVDLGVKPITRKIQIGDIGDIASRKSSHSYSIKLPRTSRNVLILDMLGVLGNSSRKPYERIVCDYVVDGIALVSNGYAVVNSTSEFFEFNIFDGIIDLSERLKGKKLTDLELSDIDHTLTTQNYVDSYSNTEGYIYTIADYGLGYSSNIKVEQQAPSIYTHTLFRRIFESIGINLIGDFFTVNQDFTTEVITPSKGYTVEEAPFTNTAKGNANTNNLGNYTTSNSLIVDNRKFDILTQVTGTNLLNGELTINQEGRYKIEFTSTFTSYKTYLTISVRVNGKAAFYKTLSEASPETFTATLSLAVGDKVSYHLRITSHYPENENDRFVISYGVQVNSAWSLQTGGQLIQPVQYLGDVNQIDFIKDVIQRYGLVLHPIQNSEDYNFRQMEAILSDQGNFEDWTNKLVDINNEDYAPSYAKVNIAKYQYPEQIVIPNNDGSFILDNENIGEEKTIFTSVFTIPNTAGTLQSNQVYSIPVWELKDGAVENKETPIKVMRIKRADIEVNAKMFDEATGVTVTEGVPFASLENISMAYFLGNFYKSFSKLMNSFKKVEMILNLSVIDIYNLDFFKLKFFKHTGRYYYLNSVKHTPEKLVKASFAEILEFPTNEPPTQIGNYEFNMSHDSTRSIIESHLTTGYFDPEQNPPFKLKIIDGFNPDLVLTQAGVEITTETEILFSELDLKVFDALGGLGGHSATWHFTIMDTGSGQYSPIIATITANVTEVENNPPVARAGEDQSTTLPPPDTPFGINVTLNGSQSYDTTGEIISYKWEIISKPSGSNATVLEQFQPNPIATLSIPNEFSSAGSYTLRLTVRDEYLAAATDDTIVYVLQYKP